MEERELHVDLLDTPRQCADLYRAIREAVFAMFYLNKICDKDMYGLHCMLSCSFN
jgi:hypothetical protein